MIGANASPWRGDDVSLWYWSPTHNSLVSSVYHFLAVASGKKGESDSAAIYSKVAILA